MITTTLKRIRTHGPCEDGWINLLKGLGKTKADDDRLPFAEIARINGLDDALWCCRAEPDYDREWRLFAIWCARQVQHLIKDPRSIAALDVAERFANGKATDGELSAARAAARAAARDASGAAAWDAAWNAAWDAAWTAARDASGAAARDASEAAAWAAAWRAAMDAQLAKFMEIVS